MKNTISLKGVRTHNLKNFDIDLQTNKITCIYGPSGSGKSSLAFHTLVAESKRRYMNSLPNDVKFFWNMPLSADVDSIRPILPVWALAQHNPVVGSRMSLADTMGLTELIQKLYFYHSHYVCPKGHGALERIDMQQVAREQLLTKTTGEDSEVFHFYLNNKKYRDIYGEGPSASRSYCFESESAHAFDHEDLYWEVFRLKTKDINQLAKRLDEDQLKLSDIMFSVKSGKGIFPFESDSPLRCKQCDYEQKNVVIDMSELSPFSAAGACNKCNGHGMTLEYDRDKLVKYPYLSIDEGAISVLESSHFSYLLPYLKKELKKEKISTTSAFQKLNQTKIWKILEKGKGDFPGLSSCYAYLEARRYKRTVRIFSRRLKSEVLCPDCRGSRLNKKAHNLSLIFDKSSKHYQDLWFMSISEAFSFFKNLSESLTKKEKVVSEIMGTLNCAESLGVGNIKLWKKAKYLSGSEYQRSLLTKILGYEGSGVLFVLDEPSFDLTLEEQEKLYECLVKIRDQGNTVVLVEHSEYLRSQSDYGIEIGPGAGELGGEVLSNKKLRKRKFEFPKFSKKNSLFKNDLRVSAFEYEDYCFKQMSFPLHKSNVVWGDSGSGKNVYFKQFLINTLYYAVHNEAYDDIKFVDKALIENIPAFKDIILFDSSVTKVSSRSTVGTTIGLSPELRKYFASLPVSKELALSAGHFSPNSELGKCVSCEGKGVQEIEMSFLEDITLACEDCQGKKLKPFLASIDDGQFSVYEAFNKPMKQVIPKLKLTPKYQKIWSLVETLNLSYLSLDRPLTSLSGGERVRIKILSQLAKKIEDSFLIFDNISTGLSKKELWALFDFVESLKFSSNTVVVLDQNPYIIERADHQIYFTSY